MLHGKIWLGFHVDFYDIQMYELTHFNELNILGRCRFSEIASSV